MKRFIFTMALLLVSLPFVAAQNTAPCSSAAHQQFDFWVGDWEVYNTQADTVVGYNKIKRILNSCVIEENWTGKSGSVGKSFNTYNPQDSTWNQIWVDNVGSRFEFSGRYHDQIMDLAGEVDSPQGKVLFTLKFHNQQSEGTVRQVWKMSRDGGKNWQLLFDGTYKKKS
ncbi:MAG: hypothetical protein AAGG75_00470 [Bacteroidota bacterium]